MYKIQYVCTVCGHRTLQTKDRYEICPVCFWEDEGDIEDISKPTYGPNGALSVEKARINYRLYGAVYKKFTKNVRPPLPEEMVDSGDNLKKYKIVMDSEAFLKEVAKKIQAARVSIDEVSYSDDGEVKLQSGNMQLVIYQKDKLIGYEIYPADSPYHGFMSDNDLYEGEDIIESTRKEILYVLNEYIEKRISMHTKLKRTWYGKDRIKYYINLTLPTGENIECKLPCINQIDFGL